MSEEKRIEALREALINIMRHMEIVAGKDTIHLSACWRIANDAVSADNAASRGEAE